MLGGLLAIAGGVLGSVLIGRMDNARERSRAHTQHRAAVRAVVFELSQNSAVADGGKGSASTTAYDSLLLPLFSELPAATASHVSMAYALIHVIGIQGSALNVAAGPIGRGQAMLRKYAVEVLGLEFPPTQ